MRNLHANRARVGLRQVDPLPMHGSTQPSVLHSLGRAKLAQIIDDELSEFVPIGPSTLYCKLKGILDFRSMPVAAELTIAQGQQLQVDL
ncbi:MAG: hypothetical protein ACI835_003513 [Planctomycetota bacterium]|jgi:hypothetical protein